MSKIENGIKAPSIDQVVIIADTFGVSINYLVHGERFESTVLNLKWIRNIMRF